MEKLEFFNAGNLTKTPLNVKVGNQYKQLNELLDNEIFARELRGIFSLNEKCREVFNKMRVKGIIDPFKQMTQFIICNLSKLDNKIDIDETGKINVEYVECEYKGANRHCPFAMAGDPKPFCIKKYKFS